MIQPLSLLRRGMARLTGGDHRRLDLIETVAVLATVVMSLALVIVLAAWMLDEPTVASEPEPEEEPTSQLQQADRAESAVTEIPIGGFGTMLVTRRKRVAPQGDPSELQPRVFVAEYEAVALLEGAGTNALHFERELKKHRARIHEAIDEVIRTATDAELDEPDLHRLRRRVRDAVNTILGKPLVDDVVFSRFRAFEMSEDF